MSIATATVTIAPYPVPMQVDEPPPGVDEPPPGEDEIDRLSESYIQAHYSTYSVDQCFAEMEEACVKIEAVTDIMNECSSIKMEEPVEEARVMVSAEVTEMLQSIKNLEGPLPTPTPTPTLTPTPTPTPIPKVVRQSHSAFSAFAKDLPSCCPVSNFARHHTPGSVPKRRNTTLPAQHVIAAFFAGALIGCALVMCFSDTGVVVAE
jgi:hypothetical protein